MSETSLNPEQNLEQRAQIFKALGHPVRLLIVNLLALKPRHGEELAAILKLNPATVSHHLSQLSDAGLLTAQRDQYYQMYSLVEDMMQKTLGDLIRLTQPGLANKVEEDAFREKVLRGFFRHGRLVQIPAQLKKFQAVLEHIVQSFEPDQRYSEQEVNRILLDFHEDVASLRRGMIDQQLMQREKGIYWRIDVDSKK